MPLNEVFRAKTHLLLLYILFQSVSLGMAAVLFYFYNSSFDIPGIFVIQIYIGIACVFIISLFMIVLSKHITIVVLISLSLFISLVLGYPLNTHIEIELFLYLSLCAASFILLRKPLSDILALVVIGSALVFQRSSLSWGRIVEPPDVPQLILLSGSLYTGFIVFHFLNGYIRLHHKKDGDIAQLEDTVKRLTRANLGFQDYTVVVEEQSRTNERNRITRELHDVVGYTLTNITMMMEEGIDLYKQNDVKELLYVVVKTRDQARNGHAEIGEALKKLRTIDSRGKHFFKTIDNMIKTFRNATGLHIEIEYTNFPLHIDDAAGSCIFRLVQEGMTNAVRHGKATVATIILSLDVDELLLSVYDNGKGCLNLQEGLGITGMRERLKQIGGSIEFKSSVTGFQFIARIPFNGNRLEIMN